MKTVKIFGPNNSVYYGFPSDLKCNSDQIWLELDEGSPDHDCPEDIDEYIYRIRFDLENGKESFQNDFRVSYTDIPRLHEMKFLGMN